MPEQEQHLVDEQVAAYVTGRPPSTVRRWAAEGRLTRHPAPAGSARSGRFSVLYDLLELPAAVRGADGQVTTPGATPPVLPPREGSGTVAA